MINSEIKKYKKAFLHVGLDKTGSKSIQSTFNHNRDLLASYGIHYPLGNWHPELGSCFCDEPENYIFNLSSGLINREKIKEQNHNYLLRLCEEFKQSKSEVLVLSYEGFTDLDEVALIRLRDFIAEYASTCELVFYVKSPVSYAISGLSQRIKFGLASWPDNFAETLVQPTGFYLDKLCKVFGKECINVRNFSPTTLKNGNVVLDFLSLLDLPEAVSLKMTKDRPIENQALSDVGIQIGDRIINQLKKNGFQSDVFIAKVTPVLMKIKGGKPQLSTEQYSDIISAAEVNSDYLTKEFGITFDPEPVIAKKSIPLISEATIDSLVEILLGFVLPESRVVKETLTPDLTIISGTIRGDARVAHRQLMIFDVEFFLYRDIQNLEMGIHIIDSSGYLAFGINSSLLGQSYQSILGGAYCVSHLLIADLPSGNYNVGFAFTEKLSDGRLIDLAWKDNICEFNVVHEYKESFIGYSYVPAEISLCQSTFAKLENIVIQPLGTLLPLTSLTSMIIGSQVSVSISIINKSNQVWLGDVVHPIYLSYHWLTISEEMVIYEGIRSPLPETGISAGKSIDTEMIVEAPNQPGVYRLVLTLLQERIGWFEDNGFEAARISVIVEK